MIRSRLFRRIVFACALMGALVAVPLFATAADPIVEITAWGNGHGVGMSQNGAGGMAERGSGYAAILKTYYKGITVAPDKVVNRTIDVAITGSASRQTWTVVGAEGTLTFAYSGGSKALPAGRYTITAAANSTVRVVNTATTATHVFPITSSAGLQVWGSNSVPRDGVGLSAVALVEATSFKTFWGMTSNQSPAFGGKLLFRPVTNAPTQLTVVNRLSMNDYLMGVEPFEMGPSFPLEARRAQAVAARSYIVQRAYGSAQTAAHSTSPVGYTDAVQVYKGFGIYYADTKTLWQYQLRKGTTGSGHVSSVVSGINNQVAAYNGLAINAMFSASHGGKSENSENVFVAALPYLKGVNEPYPAREGYSVPTRTLRFTGDQILTALRAQWPTSAPPAGTQITGFEISKLGYSRPTQLKAIHPGYGTGVSYYSGSSIYSFYRKLGFNSTYSKITPLAAPVLVSRTATLAWDDASNQDGIRPAAVRVTLLKNGVSHTTADLTQASRWAKTWSNLMRDENGKAVNYTLRVDAAPAGYTFTIDQATLKVTAKHVPATMSRSASLTWDDVANQDGIRPASVNISVLKNGAVQAKATLSPANSWAATWNNLPQYSAGAQALYTVRVDSAVTGYTFTIDQSTLKIAAKHVPATVSKTVSVAWDDDSNRDAIRPATVTVQLRANGSVVDSYELSGTGAAWSREFKGLPRYSGGREIVYTTSLASAVSGYALTYNQSALTITAKHAPATVSRVASISWDDDSDRDGLRPASVAIQLLANGAPSGAPVALDAAGGWIHGFSGLPRYDAGIEIVYSLGSPSVKGYTPALNGFAVTLTHAIERTQKTVTMVWDDKSDRDELRPEKVQVQLMANGSVVGTADLTGENDTWSHTWSDLPVNAGGTSIDYRIAEIGAIMEYQTTVAASTLTITNRHVPGRTHRTVAIDWNDDANRDGIRPNAVKVTLLADGEALETVDVSGPAWTHTFSDLYLKNEGAPIVYKMSLGAPASESEYKMAADGFLVTGAYVPAQRSVTGSVAWDDDANRDGKRPTSVTLRLLADGQPVGDDRAVEGPDWSYSWDSLPQKAAGVDIDYSVIAVLAPNGYTATSSAGALTLVHVPETVDVTTRVDWDDDSDRDGVRPDTVDVQLFADGVASGDPVALTAESHRAYTWQGLPKYADGRQIVYTVESVGEVAGYDVTVAGLVITAAHTPEKVDHTVTKVWVDEKNGAALRPDSVMIRLLADGTPHGDPVKVSSEMGWEYTWTDLFKSAAGREIVYSVEEVDVTPGYRVDVEGFTLTNTFESTPTPPAVEPDPESDPDPTPGEPARPGNPGDMDVPNEPLTLDEEQGESVVEPKSDPKAKPQAPATPQVAERSRTVTLPRTQSRSVSVPFAAPKAADDEPVEVAEASATEDEAVETPAETPKPVVQDPVAPEPTDGGIDWKLWGGIAAGVAAIAIAAAIVLNNRARAGRSA